MFLSIIIPIYNKSAYLPDCMQSVLKQNIPPEQYEIICVDDGSTDDSLQVLEQYAAQNSNVHVFSKKNGGVSSARNLGLKYAAGDYVWFIDPDDFIAPNCLSTILKKCCEENCEWLVVGSYQFTDDAKAWMTMASAANDLKPDPLNHGSACTKVIKRNLITKKQVVFDECMTYAEDSLFLHELGYKPGMPYLPQTVYFYRSNPQSVTSNFSTSSIIARVDSFIRFAYIIDCEIKSSPENGLADKRYYMLSMALYYIADLPLNKRKLKMKELRRKGLFPCKRSKTCTVDQLYMTSRKDVVGRFFNYVTVHAATNVGYLRLLAMKKIIMIRHRTRN